LKSQSKKKKIVKNRFKCIDYMKTCGATLIYYVDVVM